MITQHDNCPVCGLPFTDSDDVVYCPECGTPHHRACWEQNGCCAHAAEHAEGFVWQSAASEDDNGSDPSKSTSVRCPRCGADCAADALVCPECGRRFGVIPNNGHRFDYNVDYFMRGIDDDPSEDLGGATVQETAMFTQYRAAVYVRKFRSLKDGKKTGWNWAAFLFSPFWFYYRKAYRAGALFLGAMMVLGFFTAIPVSKELDNAAQIIQEYITLDASMTFEQKISEFASLQGEALEAVQNAQQKMIKALLVYSAVLFIPNFFAAVFADGLYKKKVVRDVQSMRDFASDEHTFRMLMLQRGGVSVLGPAACYLIMSMFFELVFSI